MLVTGVNKRCFFIAKSKGLKHMFCEEFPLGSAYISLYIPPLVTIQIQYGGKWKCAFKRIDPTLVAHKMIKLGIRSSIVKVGINFLREQKMLVKMNGHASPSFDLMGGRSARQPDWTVHL